VWPVPADRARIKVLAAKRSLQLSRAVVIDLNLISDRAGRLIHGTATLRTCR
jgi:hypothetical protein